MDLWDSVFPPYQLAIPGYCSDTLGGFSLFFEDETGVIQCLEMRCFFVLRWLKFPAFSLALCG